jgi:hypothetical protein
MRKNHPMHIWQVHARTALAELFLEHPRALGESYWEHQRRASRFGATLIGAGAACLVHGLVPGMFQRTGSTAVRSLYEQMAASSRIRPRRRTLTATEGTSPVQLGSATPA